MLDPAHTRLLQLLAQGHTQPSAAKATGWGYESVRLTVKDARRVLGARNTTHAVALAIRQGIIVP